MEIKTLLTEERSITFKPVEGKEYTKHKYSIKTYTDLEYIEDIINEVEEYEMEEKEYKAVSIFCVDDKPIIKLLSEEYEDAIDILVSTVFPELRPIINELDIFGGEYTVKHVFPYDTLVKDGRYVEEVTNFSTDDTDLQVINMLKIYEFNTGEDEIYHVEQVPKHDSNGVFIGVDTVNRRIQSLEFYTSFYNFTNTLPMRIKATDEHGNMLSSAATYAFKDSFDTASELIKITTPALLSKYASLIEDVFNTKEFYRSKIFQEFRVNISEILDSLKDVIINIEPSIERENSMNDESKRKFYETRLDACKNNKALNLLNKKVAEHKEQMDSNLDIKFYNYIDGEDRLYKNVKDVIKDEILEVISLTYYGNKDIKNDTASPFIMNNDKTIYITKDNRIFISTNILNNIFTNIDIFENIPKNTFYEMIDSLGLTILMSPEYSLERIDHMMYNLYWEITSPKQMMTRTISSLLGGNFNIRTDEVLVYVNELKNIIREVNETVNNK